jgi:LmbE family N-acetylglucosaminyl deacetylase
VEWIYLSPHFDDCAFSCGGLIWEQSSGGDNVQVWTICAGDVPAGALSQYAEEHHQRWQTGREAVELRKMEDMQAFGAVGNGIGLSQTITTFQVKTRRDTFIRLLRRYSAQYTLPKSG